VTWPHRDSFIVHVAGVPDDGGKQKCDRCGKVLHAPATGALAPWSPGTRVAVSDSGQVRMAVREWSPVQECVQQVPAAA
jgi:hypothetical protein